MSFGWAWALLALLWVVASTAGGAVLAALARRMDAGLSFRRLWTFYTLLLALAAAAVFAIAWW